MASTPIPLTVLGPSALENDWSHHGNGLGFLTAGAVAGLPAPIAAAVALTPRFSIPWAGRAALLAGAVCLAVLAVYLLRVSRANYRAAKELAAVTSRTRELLIDDTVEVHYFSGRLRKIPLAEAVVRIDTFNTGSPARQKCELITVDTERDTIGLPLWDKPRPTAANFGESMYMNGPSMRKTDSDLGQLILVLSRNPHPSAANAVAYLHSLMDTSPTWRGWHKGRRGFGQWLGDYLSH